jgi:PAS domain S-box-containing protein
VQQLFLSGRERFFPEDEIIVSKTDTKGRITYANDIFLEVSGYSEDELVGAPHSIIRHPAMPRAVFKLLWESIGAGREIFAYVNNRAKNGDHYWVFAHVTPWFDKNGAVAGYHSFRRLPKRAAIAAVTPLYQKLLDVEAANADRKAGIDASVSLLFELLKAQGVSYDRFVLSL